MKVAAPNLIAQAGGFSLHAGIDIEASQRQKLERLCRYVSRPPVAVQPVADPARPPTPRHVAMNWAQRLKRVFGIEINSCARCGGKLKIIASIEEPAIIAKILAHLQRTAPDQYPSELPPGARVPPLQASLL